MEVFNLNIIPGSVAPIIHASQYDDGREFRANLFEGPSVYTLTGAETITINVRKPDGHIVTASVDVVEGQAYVDIVTTEQMCAVEGENICELKISKDNAEIYSLNFKMMVEKSVTEGGDPSESFIYNLRTQIAEGVAEEVATQYDSANVIFDNAPTSGHGTPYTVTSEGIKTAIDNAFDYDNTASGSLVHIEDGADNIPVKSLVSQIVAVESGNGQPKSPDNPYTISGFDNGVVSVCGVNLWNETTKNGYWKVTDGSYVSVAGQLCSNDYIPVKENTTYYFYKGSTTNQSEVLFYDKNKTYISYLNYSQCVNKAFTTPLNCAYVTFNLGSYYGATYLNDISFNYPSSDTSYHAYNGNTYTFTFGQTVYGGHFDNKGNLVVTHKIVDMGLIDWRYLAVGDYYVFGYQFLDKAQNSNEMCSCYKVTQKPRQSLLNYELGTYNLTNALNYITIRDGDYTDATAFKTAMNGQKIVYELATPITLSITSQDIPTLSGENNIFSNCGDVEVEYYTNKANDILDFINSEIDKKNGDNIPIEEGSADSIKDYIDNVSLSGLSDTDISGETSGQILAFDGAKWVNTNQIVVKYEEKDIAFDSSGEGTLYYANGYILGLKDIPSDSLYIGYITYMAGTKTMVKGFNRSATSFDSTAIANTTRKIGIYYLDNIATQ